MFQFQSAVRFDEAVIYLLAHCYRKHVCRAPTRGPSLDF